MRPTNDQSVRKKEEEEEKVVPRVQENAYIFVFNWREDKIVLKNKNFGIVSASKLLFEMKDPNYSSI